MLTTDFASLGGFLPTGAILTHSGQEQLRHWQLRLQLYTVEMASNTAKSGRPNILDRPLSKGKSDVLIC